MATIYPRWNPPSRYYVTLFPPVGNAFKEVSLASYRGQYVCLFFYPADFTFVCASEVPGFEKAIKEFESRNCQVLACSTDTQHAHKAWKVLPTELGGIGHVSYPIIADVTKEIARKYDVLMDDGLCARGIFLIDKEGKVQFEHKNNKPFGRALDEPLRLLDALQFHEKSMTDGKTQVCPMSWKKGQPGMTPSLEGVADFGKDGGLGKYVA